MRCPRPLKQGSDVETHLGSSSRGTPTHSADAEGGLPFGKRLVLGVKRSELLGGLLLSQLIACHTIPLSHEPTNNYRRARACSDRWDRAEAVEWRTTGDF